MSRKNFAMMLATLSIAIVLQACTQASDSGAAENDNANRQIQVSTGNSNHAAVDLSNASKTSNSVDKSTNSALAPNKQSIPTVTSPAPKIGSGANDMALFTQVRGKLSSDKELINSVVVEIKEGNVTLKGEISNEEQKKKAERLVQEVQGIKSIKNNLRISS